MEVALYGAVSLGSVTAEPTEATSLTFFPNYSLEVAMTMNTSLLADTLKLFKEYAPKHYSVSVDFDGIVNAIKIEYDAGCSTQDWLLQEHEVNWSHNRPVGGRYLVDHGMFGTVELEDEDFVPKHREYWRRQGVSKHLAHLKALDNQQSLLDEIYDAYEGVAQPYIVSYDDGIYYEAVGCVILDHKRDSLLYADEVQRDIALSVAHSMMDDGITVTNLPSNMDDEPFAVRHYRNMRKWRDGLGITPRRFW